DVLNYLAQSYIKNERYQDAVDVYNRALAADPTFGPAVTGLCEMYKQMKERDVRSMQQTFRLLTLFVGVLCIGLMVVSPEAVLLFGSHKYIDAAPVIPPVAGSVFFIFLYTVLSFPQFYFEKTKFLMVASILAAALNIGLNWVFIQIFGFVAAGYTTLTCYIDYSVGHYFVSKKIL
ncbi:MAG: polysaccharide biosynthesis C-terminal domain-containing protein, partial [Oscillospiraceae bacterium]|nr:polysaccharide biosynthesis C-terminal domain-containing protein [Oscillospiraceae bacterium]